MWRGRGWPARNEWPERNSNGTQKLVNIKTWHLLEIAAVISQVLKHC